MKSLKMGAIVLTLTPIITLVSCRIKTQSNSTTDGFEDSIEDDDVQDKRSKFGISMNFYGVTTWEEKEEIMMGRSIEEKKLDLTNHYRFYWTLKWITPTGVKKSFKGIGQDPLSHLWLDIWFWKLKLAKEL